MKDIDKYNKELSIWGKVADLDAERHGCGVAVVGKLYIYVHVGFAIAYTITYPDAILFLTKIN
jgi:hypothetical protein